MRILLLLFIALPILELWLLFKVSSYIGFFPTLALVLAIGALGIWVLRRQGINTLTRAQDRMRTGELPTSEFVHGFCIAAGGVLFLVPGFITDIIALVFLFPFTRRILVRQLLKAGQVTAFTQGGGGFTFMHMGGGRPGQPNGDGQDIYEGEFTREQDAGKPLAGPDESTRDE